MVERSLAHIAHVEGARLAGVPPSAVPAHGGYRAYVSNAVPYVSDTPFDIPYADRPTCAGKRTDGHQCNAKAVPGKEYCVAHDPEG